MFIHTYTCVLKAGMLSNFVSADMFWLIHLKSARNHLLRALHTESFRLKNNSPLHVLCDPSYYPSESQTSQDAVIMACPLERWIHWHHDRGMAVSAASCGPEFLSCLYNTESFTRRFPPCTAYGALCTASSVPSSLICELERLRFLTCENVDIVPGDI